MDKIQKPRDSEYLTHAYKNSPIRLQAYMTCFKLWNMF
jgi:hypothetical protein